MSIEASVLPTIVADQYRAFSANEEIVSGVTAESMRAEHGENIANAAMTNTLIDVMFDDFLAQNTDSGLLDDVDVDQMRDDAKLETTEQAQSDADEALSDLMKYYHEQRTEELESEMGSAPGEVAPKQAASDISNHWLVVLAKAMGGAAGEHLKKAVELGKQIAEVSGRTDGNDAQNAKDMAELQAQMQAHTQMFKLASEATSTIIKTTGEGMSSMARKQ